MKNLGGKRTPYSDVLTRYARLYREAYGVQAPTPTSPVTIDGLIISWLNAHGYWSELPFNAWPKKSRWRRDNLNKFGEFCEGQKVVDLNDLKSDVLCRFADHCKSMKWSAWTIRHYVFAAAAMLKWARRQGFLDLEFDHVKLPKGGYTPKDVSPPSLRDILMKIEASKRLRRAGDLFRFCLMVGCRPGEARIMQWKHLRLDQSIAILGIDEHKTGERTGVSRTIHLTPEAIELLKSVRPKDAQSGDHVFTSRLGKPYTVDGFSSIIRRLGTFPYAARHTWAQNAVDRGLSLDIVGEQMGHQDPKTTRKYARVRSARILDAITGLVSPLQGALRVEPEPSSEKKVASKKSRSQEMKQPRRGKPAKVRNRHTE